MHNAMIFSALNRLYWQIFILLLADTMNSVFDLVFIYDRLVVQFGICLSFPFSEYNI